MRNPRNYIILLLLLLSATVIYLFISYGDDQPVEPVYDSTTEVIQLEKFSLKSAIVSLKSTKQLAGSDVYVKVYIADSGKKYCAVTDTKLTYEGNEIVTTEISVTKDGYIYTYSPEKKTGVRYASSGNLNMSRIDFAGMNVHTMEEQGFRHEGTETILDKECDVFTLNKPEIRMQGRYCVWQTIPLRYRTSIDNLDLELVATKIEENAAIPKDIFDIPKDIKFHLPLTDSTSTPEPSPSANQ